MLIEAAGAGVHFYALFTARVTVSMVRRIPAMKPSSPLLSSLPVAIIMPLFPSFGPLSGRGLPLMLCCAYCLPWRRAPFLLRGYRAAPYPPPPPSPCRSHSMEVRRSFDTQLITTENRRSVSEKNQLSRALCRSHQAEVMEVSPRVTCNQIRVQCICQCKK